jgi:hypothetical protein
MKQEPPEFTEFVTEAHRDYFFPPWLARLPIRMAEANLFPFYYIAGFLVKRLMVLWVKVVQEVRLQIAYAKLFLHWVREFFS